jgi:valyl-tRNA synthetase
LEDRWIRSRLNAAADVCNKAIGQNRFHEAAQAIWHFFWDEFCDWYIELKKLRFRDNSGLDDNWRNLLSTFEAALRLMHPAMPFLTEELWQRLAQGSTGQPKSISLAAYPQFDENAHDADAERQMALLQDIISSARNLRAEMKVDPKEQLEGSLYSNGEARAVATENLEAILKLAGLKLTVNEGSAPQVGPGTHSTNDFDLVLQVSAAQVEMQRKRLEKEIEQLARNIANSQRQLGDEKFLSRAPAHVVDGIRTKLTDYEAQLEKSRAALNALA